MKIDSEDYREITGAGLMLIGSLIVGFGILMMLFKLHWILGIIGIGVLLLVISHLILNWDDL